MSGDKKTNGAGPGQNRVNGTEDVNMTEDKPKSMKGGKINKDKDGDEEMTVVVPASKPSNTPNGTEKGKEGDVAMNGISESNEEANLEPVVDPKEKAISGMNSPGTIRPFPY